MNPPTVEGWHTGREWIDSGTLVERINYASELLGNTELPGVQSLVSRLMGRGDTLSPEAFVDGCLDLIGPITLDEGTREEFGRPCKQERRPAAWVQRRGSRTSPSARERCSR